MFQDLLLVIRNDKRTEEFIKSKELLKAAEFSILVPTSKKIKIKILEIFIKEKRIEIKTSNLYSLDDKTLRYLLISCLESKKDNLPKILITKKRKERSFEYF
jgi:hypothetical protein